jgi:hypothetical protein
MRLGEILLPWKFNDKKGCFYKTPYVAAPILVLGDVIANSPPYARLPTDAPTIARNYFLFMSDEFLKRPI